jgi:hypothetical protein
VDCIGSWTQGACDATNCTTPGNYIETYSITQFPTGSGTACTATQGATRRGAVCSISLQTVCPPNYGEAMGHCLSSQVVTGSCPTGYTKLPSSGQCTGPGTLECPI